MILYIFNNFLFSFSAWRTLVSCWPRAGPQVTPTSVRRFISCFLHLQCTLFRWSWWLERMGWSLRHSGTTRSHQKQVSHNIHVSMVGISVAYQWHISGISVAYQRHISGISVAYQWLIRGISLAYQRHISGISESHEKHIISLQC